jgi:hypothetical protein
VICRPRTGRGTPDTRAPRAASCTTAARSSGFVNFYTKLIILQHRR